MIRAIVVIILRAVLREGREAAMTAQDFSHCGW
jgi:hypothetical protein